MLDHQDDLHHLEFLYPDNAPMRQKFVVVLIKHALHSHSIDLLQLQLQTFQSTNNIAINLLLIINSFHGYYFRCIKYFSLISGNVIHG